MNVSSNYSINSYLDDLNLIYSNSNSIGLKTITITSLAYKFVNDKINHFKDWTKLKIWAKISYLAKNQNHSDYEKILTSIIDRINNVVRQTIENKLFSCEQKKANLIEDIQEIKSWLSISVQAELFPEKILKKPEIVGKLKVLEVIRLKVNDIDSSKIDQAKDFVNQCYTDIKNLIRLLLREERYANLEAELDKLIDSLSILTEDDCSMYGGTQNLKNKLFDLLKKASAKITFTTDDKDHYECISQIIHNAINKSEKPTLENEILALIVKLSKITIPQDFIEIYGSEKKIKDLLCCLQSKSSANIPFTKEEETHFEVLKDVINAN